MREKARASSEWQTATSMQVQTCGGLTKLISPCLAIVCHIGRLYSLLAAFSHEAAGSIFPLLLQQLASIALSDSGFGATTIHIGPEVVASSEAVSTHSSDREFKEGSMYVGSSSGTAQERECQSEGRAIAAVVAGMARPLSSVVS